MIIARRRSPLWDLPLGQDPLSRFLKQRRSEEHSRQMLIQIARETGVDLPPVKQHKIGDPKALRGIPVTGVPGGIGGTIADTQPERATIAKDERRRRRYDQPDG